jgi:hypothetical protein
MKKRQHATAVLTCFDRDGKFRWQERLDQNTWHDEGELSLLSAYFATAYANYGAPPANLYLGLDARSSVAEADTLASLSGEPTIGQYNYARQALATNGTGASGQPFVISQPAAAYQVLSATKTFTATGGNWPAVTKLFLCTHLTAVASASGQRLLCTLALSASRTLLDGDSLQASMSIGISE